MGFLIALTRKRPDALLRRAAAGAQ